MQNQKPSNAFEITRKMPEESVTDFEEWEPHELIVASIIAEPGIKHCSGLSLPKVESSASTYCPESLEPSHFEHVLEQGQFCLEIPTETFLSDVMAKKLLKAPPHERVKELARIMYQEGIPRVIIEIPENISLNQEKLS